MLFLVIKHKKNVSYSLRGGFFFLFCFFLFIYFVDFFPKRFPGSFQLGCNRVKKIKNIAEVMSLKQTFISCQDMSYMFCINII